MIIAGRPLSLVPVALAISGVLAVGAAWAGEATPWKEPKAEAVIPLYLSSHRVLVMMRIGDHPPTPVVFDTGAGGAVLDTTYAAPLNLPRLGPPNAIDGGAGKPAPGYQTRLAGVRLGGAPIPDGPADVLDHSAPDEVGVFGPNSFPGKLVLLDLEKAELRILPNSAIKTMAGPGAPYLGEGGAGLPSLPVELPGLTVDAILDTGNDSALLLPLDLAEKMRLTGDLKVVGEAISASGSQPVYEGQVAGDVRIGAVTLHGPQVRFIKGGRPNIGLPTLRRMTLAFDHTNRRTWVLGAAAD